MGTHSISSQAASARESARDAKGRFGSHVAGESGATLTRADHAGHYDDDQALDYVDECLDHMGSGDACLYDVNEIRDELFDYEPGTDSYVRNDRHTTDGELADLIDRHDYRNTVSSSEQNYGEFDEHDNVVMTGHRAVDPDSADEDIERAQAVVNDMGVTGGATYLGRLGDLDGQTRTPDMDAHRVRLTRTDESGTQRDFETNLLHGFSPPRRSARVLRGHRLHHH